MPNVEVVRRFSRLYAQRIGVLDESYLGTGRAYGPSRVLFEIQDGGSRVSDLRRTLRLDSGYMSRLLRQLEDDGLVTISHDPDDRRHRLVHLTREGSAERRRLDRRSGEHVVRLIEPLSPRLRSELAASLTQAERIIRAATVEFEAVDPDSPPALTTMAKYFAELDERFPTGFDPGEPGAGSGSMKKPEGVFLVITAERSAIGCGGIQSLDGSTAEIKRMWIDPEWRGLALGSRLLARLEGEARELGHSRVVLDTNTVLTEAIALYERSGYRPTGRYNDNPYAGRWFEKDL